MSEVKVALALGSGAARGWAHIGVIKALEEMGVRINMVAGTSIGSLVGAGYASGRLAEVEQWVQGMNRWEVFNLLDFGFNHGGIIGGEKVFNRAREEFGQRNIEDLPVTYGAVATDLYSGREIWLRKGDLYDVSRASCAMPGVLSPKSLDGRWLIDGGLVNPVPVSLCRALGADFVIAVHLNSQLNSKALKRRGRSIPPQTETEQVEKEKADMEEHGEDDNGFFDSLWSGSKEYLDSFKERFRNNGEKAPGMFSVMASSIDIMQERITKARMAGDPPDILVQPKLGHIGIMEFYRGQEAIDLGYDTTTRMRDLIMEEIELYRERRG
ncbi:patatin-like phospholipase RssA [Idiomarina loihiensis]|jgi:NTE family protein|uniref:Bacterial patatin-like phospholipase domain containing protein n=1 Tax=Marinobacter nauticus TaxID=2743 RepID=A0A833N8A3_MARNT|nr:MULTISPECIES: patatin-like phospholipase RssA [Gammaproteobacteria]NWO02685.1 patatin-like phospholipase RssA [Idiomarinaceae bacterium]HAS23049.1 patatin-like phospholipase RssA [Idiomarina loihiensis]KAE8543772.1 Bacterial patatin-like phospholipase domain containing protein [Marinobacter nauticus]MAA61768.1 patatin [Idiomarina sp.]MBL4855745.1 patatin-like phospholipase RssA [Idiomarina sp.]|tara:strand:+ start:441 stop:1418 length:978 start_codon:yes stop_codon:yes gene_type:complete